MMTNPIVNIVVLVIGIMTVVIAYVILRSKLGDLKVRVQEDLMNDYTPEILKPIPLPEDKEADVFKKLAEEVATEEE